MFTTHDWRSHHYTSYLKTKEYQPLTRPKDRAKRNSNKKYGKNKNGRNKDERNGRNKNESKEDDNENNNEIVIESENENA